MTEEKSNSIPIVSVDISTLGGNQQQNLRIPMGKRKQAIASFMNTVIPKPETRPIYSQKDTKTPIVSPT